MFDYFEEDLDIISKLSDKPNETDNLTAADLKAKFDEGPKKLADFINNLIAYLSSWEASGSIGSDYIAGVDGENIYEQLVSLKSQLNSSVLGQLPDNSITNTKYAGNSISQDKLSLGLNTIIESIKNSLLPVGTILPCAGETIPSNMLICNGQEISRASYPALFNCIGSRYGAGNGTTTFRIPNLEGRVPVGRDTAQSEFYELGFMGGVKKHTLSQQEMPSHTHGLSGDFGASPVIYSFVKNGVKQPSLDNGGSGALSASLNIGGAGGSLPHENMPPYVTVNYMIIAKSN